MGTFHLGQVINAISSAVGPGVNRRCLSRPHIGEIEQESNTLDHEVRSAATGAEIH